MQKIRIILIKISEIFVAIQNSLGLAIISTSAINKTNIIPDN
jgi:hypothetical protein